MICQLLIYCWDGLLTVSWQAGFEPGFFKKRVAFYQLKLQWLIFNLDHWLASNQHLNEMERATGFEPASFSLEG